MFTEKALRVTIKLAEGQFSGTEENTVIIQDLPISAEITKQGGDSKNSAKVTIENLKLETVKQLTVLSFKRMETYKNIIQIDAGTKGAELTTVFIGEITSSIPKIDDSGVLSLEIEALVGYYPALIASAPVSVQGTTTIDELMKGFAQEAEYEYENKGITGSVANSVFIGSPIAKARQLAKQADIDLIIDNQKFTIQPFVAPKEDEPPLLSANTGMIGYPSFSTDGIEVNCLFNDKVKIGGYFKLESILPHASGEWQIVKVVHKLDANQTSGGAWDTTVSGVISGDEAKDG